MPDSELDEQGEAAAEPETESAPEPEAAAPVTSVEDDDGEPDEEELLPPISDHPAAAAHATQADIDAKEEAGEYYIGLWGDKPNYGCPYCAFATIQGPGAVELHILSMIDVGNLDHFTPEE